VQSVSPANLSSGVALNSVITVTFSEAMDPATVSTGTFFLKTAISPVSGAVTCTGATATFTPAAPLSYGTSYSAILTTGMKDAAGNALASNYEWSFTTPGTGGTGGGGSNPTHTPVPSPTTPIKSATMYDSDLPASPIEGMTMGFAPPSSSNDGTAEIKIKYGTFPYSVFIGVTGGRLWVGHVPPREDLPPSLQGFYDALGISDCATYNQEDGRYWFFALPEWLDISKYDPEVTELPFFVSVLSIKGMITVRYQLKN
jgi:hypothetical protein